MTDKISIIVPVYNVERYLNRCVDSIITQTYKNLEIILVDDGANDSSAKICDEYKQKDNRIIVIHKKNGGLSDARNAGIDAASGKYIGFVDSDDWIENKMYEDLYNIITKHNANIAICGFCRTANQNEKIEQKRELITEYTREQAIDELHKNKSIQDYAWNKLYERKLFKDIRYPVGKNMEDKGTTYKLFLITDKVVVTTNKYYYYFNRADSIINKINEKLLTDEATLCIERYVTLKKIYPNMKSLDKSLFAFLTRCYFTASKNSYGNLKKLAKNGLRLLKRKFYFVNLYTTKLYLYTKLKRL